MDGSVCRCERLILIDVDLKTSDLRRNEIHHSVSNSDVIIHSPTTSLLKMTTLIRRRPVSGEDKTEEEPKDRARVLRKVAEAADLFPKPKEDFQRRQTPLGACVSIVSFGAIALLLVIEVLSYAAGWDAYRTELSVDLGVSAKVIVNFDITFFAIQCHELSLDAMDASGGEENDVAHDLFKSPVDRNGVPLFVGKYNYVEHRLGPAGSIPVYDPKRDPKSPQFCGRCFISPTLRHHTYDREGGVLDQHISSTHKDACCNTCQQVMDMYDMHKLPRPQPGEVEQCISELSHSNPGCNLRGQLQLRKVKGNFHFAPGTTISLGPFGQHVHQFGLEQMLRFNVSHRINHFSIGDSTTRRFSKRGVTFPLEGMKYIVEHGLGHMKYFIQVVPTVYQNGALPNTLERQLPDLSFEYSAQYGHKEFSVGQIGGTPAVFFVFDFHPIQVTHVFERPAFGHFLVKLCCIVGGLFVVMGLADTSLTTVLTLVKNRLPDGPSKEFLYRLLAPQS
jgi:hypothetical protein